MDIQGKIENELKLLMGIDDGYSPIRVLTMIALCRKFGFSCSLEIAEGENTMTKKVLHLYKIWKSEKSK